MGRVATGFPSHRPGKQDENAAKPPEQRHKEIQNTLETFGSYNLTITKGIYLVKKILYTVFVSNKGHCDVTHHLSITNQTTNEMMNET